MAKKAKKKSLDPLVVQSKVKDYIKKNKMNCSADVIVALTETVAQVIERGCERASSNGRKTLRADDL